MSLKDYRFDDDGFSITDEMKADYQEDGYMLLRGLLSGDELKHIENALTHGGFEDRTYYVPDGDGQEIHIIMWNHPGDDVTGMVARSDKVAGTCEQLLGGEIYHYHTKLMKKPAKIGGNSTWHQDYGYWYNFGNLFPKMMTVFIAVDKCTKENSCLQVLKGSHKVGRISHGYVGSQQGADMSRVDEIAKLCPLQYVEMEPGDALFFDCNLLHCSSANSSNARRWAFLCAYNRADNNPIYHHYHPRYTPLKKVPNSAILECQEITNLEGKWFLDGTHIGRKYGKADLAEQ